MPYAERTTPEHFLLADWDAAWSLGWFRMRQSLFTTHFLEFGRRFHSAVWLRIDLTAWTTDRKFESLRKLNKRFRFTIEALSPSGTDNGHEELYARYRASLDFEPAPSLRDLLVGQAATSLFPTWQIDLYDDQKLIASGVFDRGRAACAGICSYFDPDYRKHSLGKYLIYLKMEFCKAHGMEWFYPGYIAPGERRFDYKLGMGTEHLEYYDLAGSTWLPFPQQSPSPDPLTVITGHLETLAALLETRGPLPKLRRYLHLDINLNPQVKGLGLFDDPVFLDCLPGMAPYPVLVVVFDPRDGLFHLRHCRSVYRFDKSEGDPDVLDSDLLMVEKELFSHSSPEAVADCLAGVMVNTPG